MIDSFAMVRREHCSSKRATETKEEKSNENMFTGSEQKGHSGVPVAPIPTVIDYPRAQCTA